MDYTINYDLVEKLYGGNFRELLEDLEITTFIDVNKRIEENHQYTTAQSIWFYGRGDFSFKDKKYGLIYIQTGCLAKVQKFGRIPFGEEYYEEHTGEYMITIDEYLEYVNAFEQPGSKIGDGVVVDKKGIKNLLQNFKKIEIEEDLQKYTNENKRIPLHDYIIFTIISRDNKKYYYKGTYNELFC
jgi:hypothetical protein